MSDTPSTELLQEIHQQTAKIAWQDLQRFFAQGRVLKLDESLDLVEVAVAMASDATRSLQLLVEKELLQHPSNEQAKRWFEEDTQLWSVVVAPYVLVQDKRDLAKNS